MNRIGRSERQRNFGWTDADGCKSGRPRHPGGHTQHLSHEPTNLSTHDVLSGVLRHRA